jgi:NAD-dependent DNA ligase
MFNFFKKKKKPLIEVTLTSKVTNKPKAKPIKLKNKNAEKLRKKGIVTINGIEIKLWQHHNKQNIDDQLSWNKLKDFTKLNENSTGENGNIILTGIFQIPRKEVAEYAVKLNFNVRSTVSKFTDYIIIGTENVSPSKIAKAIEYNKNGAHIKIITEDTFLTIIAENLTD